MLVWLLQLFFIHVCARSQANSQAREPLMRRVLRRRHKRLLKDYKGEVLLG